MVRHIFDSWDWIVARCCHMLPLVANDEVAEIKKLKTKAVNDDMSGLRARFRFHASIYLRHCRGSDVSVSLWPLPLRNRLEVRSTNSCERILRVRSVEHVRAANM